MKVPGRQPSLCWEWLKPANWSSCSWWDMQHCASLFPKEMRLKGGFFPHWEDAFKEYKAGALFTRCCSVVLDSEAHSDRHCVSLFPLLNSWLPSAECIYTCDFPTLMGLLPWQDRGLWLVEMGLWHFLRCFFFPSKPECFPPYTVHQRRSLVLPRQ